MVKYFAYNGNTNTYCPVSEPGNDSGDNKNHPPKDSFRKPLRIISLEGQIPTIFDNPDELIIRSSFKSSILILFPSTVIPLIFFAFP